MCSSDKTEMFRFETANFVVTATIEHDRDVDISFDETDETFDKLNSGEWTAFGTVVTVLTKSGVELGTDSLWGSIYAKPADFFTEHRGARGQHGSYFRDMIGEAVAQARKTLAAMPKLRAA